VDSYTIREASTSIDDAEALSRVEAVTLGDSDLSANEMLAVLSQPGQYIYLAHDLDGTCIGMLASFDRHCETGERLELDMLGVVAPWRGRGVARNLVGRAIDDGRSRGCTEYRAVVAVDNLASRRVFERCGLASRGPGYRLMTRVFAGFASVPLLPDGWAQESTPALAERDWAYPVGSGWCSAWEGIRLLDASGKQAAVVALQRVDTIAYSGYWIEGLWSQNLASGQLALDVAAEYAKSCELDEVGMLIPMGDDLWQAAMAAGYEHAGDYGVLVAG